MSSNNAGTEFLEEEKFDTVLSTQVEIYAHKQNQAQRILRVAIAAVTILSLFLSPPLVEVVTEIINQIPNWAENIDPILPIPEGLRTATSVLNYVIGGTLLLAALFTSADSLRLFWQVLRAPDLHPLSDGRSFSFVENLPISLYSDWISKNNQIISDMTRSLDQGYYRVEVGLYLFIWGIVIILLSAFEFATPLAFLNISLSLGVVFLTLIVLVEAIGFREKIPDRVSIPAPSVPKLPSYFELILLPMIVLSMFLSAVVAVIWLSVVVPDLLANVV